MKENWQGKTAIVTGASSGIGAAVARRLAQEGLRVTLVARRVDRLNQVAEEITSGGGQAQVLAADLAQPGECERIIAGLGVDALDVLVNNAGFGWYGYLRDMPWSTAETMLAVNVEAAAHLARLCLPGMLARSSGHIITIGSIIGSLPSQGTAMYAGTKAFLAAFTTALHRELRGSGVHASLVEPGPVATGFFDASEAQEKGRRIPAEQMAVKPERVAGAVCSLLRRPRRLAYVPGILGLTPLVEFSFGWLMDWIGPALLRVQR